MPLVSGTKKNINKEKKIKKLPNIKNAYAPIASLIIGNKKVTRVLLPQLTNTAIDVALPRAFEANNSLVISHGIAPGPIEKNT